VRLEVIDERLDVAHHHEFVGAFGENREAVAASDQEVARCDAYVILRQFRSFTANHLPGLKDMLSIIRGRDNVAIQSNTLNTCKSYIA
jgi:hypothetical protein